MPVPAMAEPVVDHQKRFQAAVDVIHNLPKNGMHNNNIMYLLHPWYYDASDFSWWDSLKCRNSICDNRMKL